MDRTIGRVGLMMCMNSPPEAEFLNEHGEETFLEPWQGVDYACGTPVAPHDGGTSATYQLDELAQTITLTGRGAYVGLPKRLMDPNYRIQMLLIH